MSLMFSQLPPALQLLVGFILVIPPVIFVHELGHFLAAKSRRVRVLSFTLGFGPRLFGWVRGGTDYKVCAFPLGGYVQMAGDAPLEDGTMPAGDEQFLSHPWPGRIWIAVAGPLANLTTAFVTMVIVAWVTGMTFADSPNVLGATADTSAAYAAGLRAGDRIVSLNGKLTPTWVTIFQTNEHEKKDRPTRLGVARAGRRFEVVVPQERRERVLLSLRPPAVAPVIGMVAAGMPAYKAGLKEGDRVLAVDGRAIRVWSDLPEALRGRVDSTVTITLLRGDQTFSVQVKPMSDGGAGDRGLIGIEAPRGQVYVQRFGLLESLQFGFLATGEMVANVVDGMVKTVLRPLYYGEYMGGPLFIAQAATQQVRRGLDALLQFFATINVAIMVFNLMPLPILDGGHILLALFEALRRKALSARAYVRFQQVGLVLLGTLFVIILANDPLRMLRRQRALDRGPHATPTEHTVAPTVR